MSSRVSTSANVVLGLDELNANGGSKEYEDIAIRLGNDKAWFTSIRTKLVEACLQKDPMHPYWDVPRLVSFVYTLFYWCIIAFSYKGNIFPGWLFLVQICPELSKWSGNSLE